MGIGNLVGGLADVQILDLPDPIFNVPFRYLMLILGMVQLVTAYVALFTPSKRFGLALATWVSLNFIFYRVGLWYMGWRHSSGFLIESLGFSLSVTDMTMSLASSLLLISSGAGLWLGWERRAIPRIKVEPGETIKIFCALCNGHIVFAAENAGHKIACPHCKATITLMKPKNVKTFCPACGGHIEIPLHGLGQTIACPHCATPIKLQMSV